MKVPFASRYELSRLAAEFCGLRLEMASDLLVQPALELGSEVKDFRGHGLSPSSSQKLAVQTAGEPSDAQLLFVLELGLPTLRRRKWI
jgi:hypothetical protein